MISIDENINKIQENLKTLLEQRNEINHEILRLEGSLRVFMDMKKVGVKEIPIEKNEVIDVDDIQGGSQCEEKKD